MLTRIRSGVFETNSSSTHSVTISEDEAINFDIDKETLRSGVINVVLDSSYGWEWKRLYLPQNKIAYLIAQSQETRPADIDADHAEIGLIKVNPRIRQIFEIIKEKTGCDVSVRCTDDWPYVDHQSVGVGYGVEFDEDRFMRFIFGKGLVRDDGKR